MPVRQTSVHKVVIRMPESAFAVSKWSSLHHQPDRKLRTRHSWQDLNGVQCCSPRCARKTNMKGAVLVRRNISEHPFVGYVLPKRVRVNVERLQQPFISY